MIEIKELSHQAKTTEEIMKYKKRMSEVRINNGDISNFLAEGNFKNFEAVYNWIEAEIENGNKISFYNFSEDMSPVKSLSNHKDFQEWKVNDEKHRKELTERIEKLKSNKK